MIPCKKQGGGRYLGTIRHGYFREHGYRTNPPPPKVPWYFQKSRGNTNTHPPKTMIGLHPGMVMNHNHQKMFLDQHFGPLKLPPSSLRPLSSLLAPSVSHKSSHTSRHYFFLIFCNKLACSKCRKVTKPDFRRKIRFFFISIFFVKK